MKSRVRPTAGTFLFLLVSSAGGCSSGPADIAEAPEFCPFFRVDVPSSAPFGWPGWDDFGEIAHRGGCCEAENTLEAIQASLERGVSAIEVDVRFTRDEIPVLMHDITIDRTTDSSGEVASMGLARLRHVNACPGRGTSCVVPTLAEALDLTRGRAAVVLDVKDMRTCGRLMSIVRVIDDHGQWDRVAMISEERNTLSMAREFSPSIPLGFYQSTGTTITDPIALAAALGPATEILVRVSEVLSEEGLFKKASERGIPVIPWTAYSRASVDRLRAAPGVSRVMSAAPPP